MAQWALSNHQGISAAPLTTGCLTAHSGKPQIAVLPLSRQPNRLGPDKRTRRDLVLLVESSWKGCGVPSTH